MAESQKNKAAPITETPFDFIKISPNVLRVTLMKNIVWIILAGILGAGIGAVASKLMIKNKWTSRCSLYKLPQSAELRKEIPSLYEPPDLNTVVESIRTRENIQKAIKRLGMDISVDAFYGKTKIQKQKNNNLFTIVAEDEDREKSAQIANVMAEIFLESYASMMQGSARKLEEQYISSAGTIRAEMTDLEKKMRKMLSDKGINSIETELGMNIQKVKDIGMKLLESRAAAETARIRLQDLDIAIAKMSPDVQISYVVTPPDAGLLKQLEAQLNELTQKFTDENPKVKRLRSEIEELKKRTVNPGKPSPEQVTYGSNQTRQTLEIEKLKVESELKSSMKNIESFEREVKDIRKSIDGISSMNEEYSELSRKLDLNRQTLSKVETMIAASGLSVKPNSLDIKIFEPAVPPAYPDSSKRKLIVIAVGGLFMGLVGALALGREVLDLTVKSDSDMSEILHVKNLGALPDRDAVNISLFNVSFQVVFENMMNELKNVQRPVIVVGSVSKEAGKSLLINECMRIFRARNKTALIISDPKNAGAVEKNSMVNHFVYSRLPFDDFHPTLRGDGSPGAFFELDETTFSYPIDEERLAAFIKEQKSYDMIIWELFDFDRNKRLFSTIARQSDLFVLVTRFRKSKKLDCIACTKFLKLQNCRDISGIVNCIHSDYFNI